MTGDGTSCARAVEIASTVIQKKATGSTANRKLLIEREAEEYLAECIETPDNSR